MTGVLDFVQHAEFKIPEKAAFQKLDLFPSSGEEKETSALLGLLERTNPNHNPGCLV
jgi:hypothetical protein